MVPQSLFNSANTPSGSISYPTFSSQNLPGLSSSLSISSASSPYTTVSVPPQASINPSRRRSEYMDGPQSPVSVLATRPVIDYPDLLSTLRPPPPAASHSYERQDTRPRLVHATSYSLSMSPPAKLAPKPLTLPNDYPVTYWSDVQINTAGLKNLGNTCYMNATVQCLRATVPFSRFFTGKVI